MKDFATLLILIVISVGGYAVYRYASLPTNLDFRRLESARQIPATVCTFSNAGFESASDGKIWIYKGSIRIESIDRQASRTEISYSIITPEGIVYSWKAGNNLGERAPLAAPDANNTFYGYPEITCEPWWLPKASLINPPPLVEFGE